RRVPLLVRAHGGPQLGPLVGEDAQRALEEHVYGEDALGVRLEGVVLDEERGQVAGVSPPAVVARPREPGQEARLRVQRVYELHEAAGLVSPGPEVSVRLREELRLDEGRDRRGPRGGRGAAGR